MGLKEFLAERQARKLFPKKKEGFWYCGEFYEYQYELYQAKKPWKSKELVLPCEKFLINWPQCYNQICEGAILPCIKLDGWIGFYLITKKWRYSSAGSDFASWDDGYEVNLKLNHCERAK